MYHSLRWLLAAIGLSFVIMAASVITGSTLESSTPGAPLNVVIWVSPPEVVMGPSDTIDNSYHTLSESGSLRSYVGNATTHGYYGGSLETLRPLSSPVIDRGLHFDSCGAWLNSEWRDGAAVRGWYHAETACNYPATDKSVAYAVSYDNGNTFVKPNYPSNQVLTAPPGLPDDADDEGDHRVIRVGDYLYMYFIASRDYQVRLARSSVADGGAPGTWFKYYNGEFSQPGIGGESSPLDPSGALTRSWVSRNTYLNRYLAFSYVHRPEYSENPSGFAGYGLTVSLDGIHSWQSFPYLLLSSEGLYWGRSDQSRELVEYMSLISPYGDSEEIGSSFWLYYMYLNPGEDFAGNRYLLRRRVDLRFAPGSTPTERVPRIALVNYSKAGDAWFTTTSTDGAYAAMGVIGYLFTDQIEGARSVFDCYAPATDDHFPMLDRSDCGGGDARTLRRMGWISQAPFTNSEAVYLCWDSANSDHFMSLSSTCAGKTYVSQLGYLAKAMSFPTTPQIALSSYFNATANDSWSSTSTPPGSYAFLERLGYLWQASRPDTTPLYDCYIDFWNDHMIDINPGCGNAQSLGLMGYISTLPFANSVRIYRCWDAQATNHFVSMDPACGGQQTEWPIGYLAVNPVEDSPRQTYLPVLLRP